MALKTVSNLKDSVAGILSGMDISNVDNLNGALERAARVLVQKADIPEASGIQNIVLYQGVTDYACDPRVFGTAINDIRPQGVSRPQTDFVYKKFGEQFDRTKGILPNGTMFTFQYANGVPIIRIASKIPLPQIVLDPMNSTSGWTAAGNASGLTQDTAVYWQSPASLRFTLTGDSTGTLTKTLNSTDLSSYQGVGVAFLAIEMPSTATAANLSSISLKIGSSASNYSLVTATQGFLGAWTAGNWLVVAFDESLTSSVGTPNWSAITYIQVSMVTLGTIVNFRVGGLWIAQPSPSQILYQSAAIFIPSGSTTAQTTITTDDDTIVLNDPSFTLYEYESSVAVLEQTGAGASDATLSNLNQKLNGNGVNTFGLYGKYSGDNPSQELRQIDNYYE